MSLHLLFFRYNFVSNEIGSVQSRGRARAKGSECYLIVTQGSANILREHQNRMREQDMMEALKKVDEMDKEELQRRIEKMQVNGESFVQWVKCTTMS